MGKKTVKTNKKTLKGLFSYLGRYKFTLIFSIIPASASVIFSLLIPFLVGEAIDCMALSGGVEFDSLYPILIKIAACALCSGISNWIFNLLINKVAFSTVADLRKDAFSKLMRLPLSYIDSHSHGETVSRIISDAEQISDGLLMGVAQLYSGVVTVAATLVIMLTIDPLTAVVVVLLTPLSLFVAKFISGKIHRFFVAQNLIKGEQTGYTQEYITSIKTVKAITAEEKALEKYRDINENYRKTALKAVFFSSLVNPTTRFVNSVVYAAAALVGGISAIFSPSFTVGMLTSFLGYSSQYAKPFNEISSVVTEFQNALACADRLFELLAEKELSSEPESYPVVKTEGRVSFNSVCFGYTPDKPLIKDLNLEVKSGQHIAIVGPTGCGKTTLINLLMRFYDVNSGAILVDGVDIRDLPRWELRKKYGMVLQDTWIKKGTVRENIAMSRPEATDEEIIEAAKACRAHDFIVKLPNGYDTVIGEDNTRLSVGQKQLLCCARIMLLDPPMLILDEATSSIDTRTEAMISRAFDKMTEGKTSFIVAHRLSTIENADMILVMKDGNIVEKGRHNELLQKGGLYYDMHRSRFN